MEKLDELIDRNGKAEGNLLGVDGNAFAIIGYTTGQLRKSGWPSEDRKAVQEIAMSGDYSNVIATCASVLTPN